MSYTEFANKMLVALYRECGGDRGVQIPIATLGERFGIKLEKPFWLRDLKEEWASLNLANFPEDGSGDRRSVTITLHGVRQAEALPSDLLPTLESGDETVESEFTGAPTTDHIATLNPHDVVLHPVPASTQFVEIVAAEVVPASDRVVRFDHNSAAHKEISSGLENLFLEIRGNNQVGETAEERDRILRSLDAARMLWSATELRVVQIKVGIILAVEDAHSALAKIGAGVGVALLVDAIKALVKSVSGIQF